MYYRVIEEKCKEGIKSRYSKNQRIDNSELFNLMNDFKDCGYEIKDELNKKQYKFYKHDVFGRKINSYSLDLIKIR